MVCRYDGRQLRMVVLVALVALGFALPVAAQNIIIGKVTDVKGAPVEGATVNIEQPSSRPQIRDEDRQGRHVYAGRTHRWCVHGYRHEGRRRHLQGKYQCPRR